MNSKPATEVERELLLAQVTGALTNEFLQRQLPRALGILAQLAGGDSLTHDDDAFLADMLATLSCASELFDHHRDIEALHRCALSLYDDIMTEAFAKEISLPAASG